MLRIPMKEDIASYTIMGDLKLEELTWMRIRNDYLYRTIPDHPEDVEFRVSYLRHNTNLQGFLGIWDSEGLKSQQAANHQNTIWYGGAQTFPEVILLKLRSNTWMTNTLTQKKLSCTSSPLPLPFCHPLAWGTSVSACRFMSC